MIASLDDAWSWYTSARTLSRWTDRLAVKYWNTDSWAETLRLDNQFRFVESSRIREQSRTVLADLDDLCVLLMFSVFEAVVRERARLDVERSLPERLHPAVEHAVRGLQREIETGSFRGVTAAFRSVDPDLIEEVDQVRRYRNWVAHGRRGSQPAFVDPPGAYDRLGRFLQKLTDATTT
jgi:hypothetical protein